MLLTMVNMKRKTVFKKSNPKWLLLQPIGVHPRFKSWGVLGFRSVVYCPNRGELLNKNASVSRR